MSKLEDKKALLTLAIEELRLLHLSVSTSFDNLRNKALALLAGEVAIITFIFSSSSRDDNWFLGTTSPIYGLVFYAIGVLLLIYAFAMFLIVIASARWTRPPDDKDVRDLYNRFHLNPLEFMEHIKNEYIDAVNHCVKIIDSRAVKFMRGVYTLASGILILLLVKYGGHIINL